MVHELAKTESELWEIADVLLGDLRRNNNTATVSRYNKSSTDKATFVNGKRSTEYGTTAGINKEQMRKGIYQVTGADIRPDTEVEAIVARDLRTHHFNFESKEIPLPLETFTAFEDYPENVDHFDQELREFSKDHRLTRVSRELEIVQQVVVNSEGGISIQSIPFFTIDYRHGYEPLPISRTISVVCNSDEQLKNLPTLIAYLADPTPNQEIKNAKTFTQAFAKLHEISTLKYGSLQETGFPLKTLYDVVVLTGVPAHEVFGHHFEEPIKRLEFGESGAFMFNQEIGNSSIELSDNPKVTIQDFRVSGFKHFDAYGRLQEKRIHVKNGKVIGFLGSEYSDTLNLKNYLGLEKSSFIGNAIQGNNSHFPQPRMSCTILDGEYEKQDLEGKLVIVSHNGHTNPNDKTYVVEAQECYVIKDGVPKRVLPVKMTGGINQAMANLTLLEGISYNVGICGKPEPLYWHNSAQIPVSQLTRTQLWRQQQVYPLSISEEHIKALTKI